MKQILQDIKTGATEIASVPVPAISENEVLIRSTRSLISAGTERMWVDFGRSGWISKARQQPDKVKMVLDKVRTEGLSATIEAVSDKLDQPLPLGYCNVGVVTECGSLTSEYVAGDRVVSNGNHAEYVAVPTNLTAKVPESVSDEAASFTVLGAIGLQGVRLVEPTLGETVVVIGLGLIGLMTVQLLRSAGCRVVGVDFDSDRLELARSFGAEVVNPGAGEDPVAVARSFSRGRGVDAVLITASTSSNEPVAQAAAMCRKRGRIVLVGVTGLELSRDDFYEKELTFQVSCSYGPGRYDDSYELRGNDYPIGFVRWTEQRNFEAVLDLLADGTLDVAPLVSHRFSINDAEAAYDALVSGKDTLGILLEYDDEGELKLGADARTVNVQPRSSKAGDKCRVAVIGAGNYAGRVLIPAFRKSGAELHTIVSQSGVSARHSALKTGAQNVSTDADSVIADNDISLVVIATRHDTHAELIESSLAAGKNVFVEKPLCLTLDELQRIEAACRSSEATLMIGFNRRFSPFVVKAKSLMEAIQGPVSVNITVNAGEVPSDHWVRDPEIGGGRIIGEGCHFVDLVRHLVGHESSSYEVQSIRANESTGPEAESAVISMKFADGSIGAVQYLTGGHRSYPKERVEIFASGRILQIDNFRIMRGWGWPGFSKLKLWKQDKGQEQCVQATVDAVRNGFESPIPADEIFEVSRLSIDMGQACF